MGPLSGEYGVFERFQRRAPRLLSPLVLTFFLEAACRTYRRIFQHRPAATQALKSSSLVRLAAGC